MILVDWQISHAIDNGEISISPFCSSQINPNSYDVRLGSSFVRFPECHEPLNPFDETDVESYGDVFNSQVPITIAPGECILAETVETIKLNRGIVAAIEGKSSLARMFQEIHMTGGWIDAGFEGSITLEIVNNLPRPFVLVPGMAIGQLVFHRTYMCHSPYGDRKGSKYQNQTGATKSRYHLNKPG
jgi:dCTP deaminase